MTDSENSRELTKTIYEALIRFTLILLMAYLCLKVFAPFMAILVWALIMGISLYPLHQKFAAKLGNKQGLTSVLMVLVTLIALGVPLVVLSNSFVAHVGDLYKAVENNTLAISPPDPKVRDWPVVGEKTFEVWSDAAAGLPEFLNDYRPEIKKVSSHLVSVAKNVISSVALLLGAFIISGIMMAYGKAAEVAMRRIFIRLAGVERGPPLLTLCTATVRSVTVGVLGVAFIQSILFGIGFIMSGMPAVGVLALVTLLLQIIQIPAILVTIPSIIYVWTGGDAGTAMSIFLTIYFIIAGLSDNILKPLLLGRGLSVPMPVILIGVLGGMFLAGFIGLFIGAVILAVGYQIFMAWVKEADDAVAGD